MAETTQQAVKAVLLDYGGVIAEEGFRNGLAELSREQGLDPQHTLEVAKRVVYETGFVTGQGAEAAFWAAMRDGAGLAGSDEVLTARILTGFALRPWVIDLVRNWREQGLLTGILSDQTHWLDSLNQRDRFFREFDYVFNSYYLGKGKRDPGLFPEIASRLALEPGEILFVDDIENNIERARAAGWQVIRFAEKASFLAAVEQHLSTATRT